jgi:hypothetical protein
MDFSALHCALFSISAIYADGLDFYFTKEGDQKVGGDPHEPPPLGNGLFGTLLCLISYIVNLD